MKQKSCQKFIYKLHSKKLRQANWNLSLPLEKAMRECPDDIVTISDSQVLRWIDELNGIKDADAKAKLIRQRLKIERNKPTTRESRQTIKQLYSDLYKLQYQKDYLSVIMDRESDYDRANNGFSVNGIRYRRFLGTNGGIKNSTIVYVNEELYPELKHRLDNGRNLAKELVPAKLEAYQALVCSGSTPLPAPKGFIVVNDCITHFKEDVITINDEADGEPALEFVKDYQVEHNGSDGFGLMLPSYSRLVNGALTGDYEHTISGMNTRYAWEKGMVYTFDFVEFAEKVAGTYEITDAWGTKRDVRDAEVILTVSMLKLWDSYDSWKSYCENCEKNHYQFSTPKVTPQNLENVRYTNYQFLQSYDLTDEELLELCKPTINEVNGVLGLDYRKSIAFLAGFDISSENALSARYDWAAKALMANPDMIDDPFIRRKIYNMIKARIEAAKRGAIKINANFAMISGDPYALAQSMFGLEITGLLNAGEIYHKYWIDKGSDYLSCFRAPMTSKYNIRKLKLNKSEQCSHWFQYMSTVAILNNWDTSCDALDGCDFDGDTMFCTDNQVILRNTQNYPTIMCIQRRAEKKVVVEDDIIVANKLAFNDEIGKVTNNITSMFDVQASFSPGSKEYEVLGYRIMCGQLYQQNTIDRAKGIIAKSMPEYWYRTHPNLPKEDDDIDLAERKAFNFRICAAKKPMFMIYVYPSLRKEYNDYIKKSNLKVAMLYGNLGIRSIDDLRNYEPKDDSMAEFLNYYDKMIPVGVNNCLVNRMARLFDSEFNKLPTLNGQQPYFCSEVLKSGVEYPQNRKDAVTTLYRDYRKSSQDFEVRASREKMDKSEVAIARQKMINDFQEKCAIICPNSLELCDIVVDLCYSGVQTKQFAWDMCGNEMLNNLIKSSGHISFPVEVDLDGDFEYAGHQFAMKTVEIREEDRFNIDDRN